MAKNIDINQTGIIVFFRYPTPNSFNDPSELYMNAGFKEFIRTNKMI
jgi:hypothetical protein